MGGGHLVTDWSRMPLSAPVVLIEDTEDESDLFSSLRLSAHPGQCWDDLATRSAQ